MDVAAISVARASAKNTHALRASDWTASRAYVVGELVCSFGMLYRVTTAHTSGTAFDVTKFQVLGNASRVRSFRRANPAPLGVKLKGGNIVPHPDDNNSWVNLWAGWDSNARFESWIKPQMQKAVAVGMNSVRFVGGLGGVILGTYTLDVYLSRVREYIEYAAELGLYVYGVGGEFGQLYPVLPEQALREAWVAGPVADVLMATGLVFNEYPNVIAYDVMQESLRGEGIWRPGATEVEQHAFNTILATAVRSVTSLPITFSHPVGPRVGDPGTTGSNPPEPPNSPSVFNMPYLEDWQAAALYCDFLDAHVYYNMALDDMTEVFKIGTPILVGEVGESQAAGESVRVQRLKDVGKVISRPDVSGGFVWAMVDQKNTADEQFGLFTVAFAPRNASITALNDWPTVDAPFVLQLKPSDTVLNQAVGVAKRLTGSNKSLTLGRPCRVVARLIFDYDAPDALDVATAFVGAGANGATPTNMDPDAAIALSIFQNGASLPLGADPIRGTVAWEAYYVAHKGAVWTFDIQAVRAAGPSLTAIANAPNTVATLTFYGL